MNRPPDLQNKAIILGVLIDDQPMDWVLNRIEQFLCSDTPHLIFTPNPEICFRAESDGAYKEVLNQASINIPDGFGLKLGAKILGEELNNRVTGSDLTKNILEKFKNKKIYILLRSDSLSKEIDIKNLFKEKYPSFEIKIGELDLKNINNCDNLINKISEFKPDILFTTLGAPYQELWNFKYKKILNAKVIIGVGGSFDFLTNKIQRAPKLLRELGMEWLFRLYQEPSRLKRIKNATTDFLLKCHEWKKRMDSTYRDNVLAVIQNKDGKFLVQKNPRFNHWQFPQGGVDKDETLEQAVVREASEEVGTNKKLLKVIKQIPETHSYESPGYSKLFKGYFGQRQTAFLLEFIGKQTDFDLTHSHEADQIKWVSKDEILNVIHPHRHEFAKKITRHL